MDERDYEILELLKRRLLGEEPPVEREGLDVCLSESETHRRFFESVRWGEGGRELFARIHEKEALLRYGRRISYCSRRMVVWPWRLSLWVFKNFSVNHRA